MYSCECWCDCLGFVENADDIACDDCDEGIHGGDLNSDDIDFLDLGGES